jgi:tRNA G18 (ribose-2'-O)-methylase SpoU
MPEERIESLDDPRLDIYRSLKTSNLVRDARLFIAEGPTVVERVLRSGFEVTSVLISDRKWPGFHQHLPDHVPVYRLTQELAERLVGFSFHCGVMASAVRRAVPAWDAVVPTGSRSLILAGDRIVDPENVGALIRIASAFGASAVLLGPGCANAFSRRVLRVSMGNVLFLPVLECADLSRSLDVLQQDYGFCACAAVLDDHAQDLKEFRFPQRTVVVFGNEYAGVSEAVRQRVRHRITIAMGNGTDSLNVAVSAGIFAWQYRTQWGSDT